MLHTKFHIKIYPMVPGKKIFKVFYHIWAWQPSWSCDLQNVDKFSLTCTYKLTFKIWLKMSQWFLREKKVKSSSINDIEPRSRNDLELQYSYIFIKSISLRSQAAIVSE